ncbi:MAG: BON domain-containing protein [Chromatiaceae bacterium]|jgi:osmotically-inducible protein OsmY|nr:BON domain-containing protein [Chromatiaceae bacterium]
MPNDRPHRPLSWPRLLALVPALVTLILTLPLLQGCAPAIVAGVVVGASTIHDRRSAMTVFEDQQIEVQGIALKYQQSDVQKGSQIAVTSYNHVVLLTGQAESEEISHQFADLMSRQPKVRRVINEVTVGPRASISRQSQDAMLTSQVKASLLNVDVPGFDPTRVKVVTESAIVYLMGLVTPVEAEAVVDKARYVRGVEKVVKVFEYIDPSAKAPA